MTSRRRGFTFVELMAVMIILGVILMAIVPSLDGLVPTYRLKGAARELASAMELGQSKTVETRKRYQIAYDLDKETHWLVLPPASREDEQQAAAAQPEDEAKKALRPLDDVEHGPPPPDPSKEQDDESAQSDAEREALQPRTLPEGVVIEAVIVGDEEKRTGQVLVPYSHLGTDGTHVIGLKLEDGDGKDGDEIWIKFNAVTRTIEYHEQRPQAKTVSGE